MNDFANAWKLQEANLKKEFHQGLIWNKIFTFQQNKIEQKQRKQRIGI